MSPRPLGEMFAASLVATEAMAALQTLLGHCADASGRKALIMAARQAEAIDATQCGLLIEAWGLETA